MNENNTINEVLAAVDELIVYRTDHYLNELIRVRNKLRAERLAKEETHAGQAARHTKDFATSAR